MKCERILKDLKVSYLAKTQVYQIPFAQVPKIPQLYIPSIFTSMHLEVFGLDVRPTSLASGDTVYKISNKTYLTTKSLFANCCWKVVNTLTS